ncbi:hemolysin D [Lentibacillus lipolyticus]|nr:hemolysin D [Lentibacillus lipolyticus]
MQLYTYTKKEEVFHAVTHGAGALLSIAGFILLAGDASWSGDWRRFISVLVFGGTMFLMYLASTIVHSLPAGKWKEFFKIADHASIYLFIAGTYTPFLLIHIPSDLRWKMLTVVWGIAVTGVLFKIFFISRFLVLSTFFYILMGWLILFVWDPLTAALHKNGVVLLVAGGLFYTTGTIFYLWRGFCYHHVIWHIFVMAGSAFHFFCIFYYVI